MGCFWPEGSAADAEEKSCATVFMTEANHAAAGGRGRGGGGAKQMCSCAPYDAFLRLCLCVCVCLSRCRSAAEATSHSSTLSSLFSWTCLGVNLLAERTMQRCRRTRTVELRRFKSSEKPRLFVSLMSAGALFVPVGPGTLASQTPNLPEQFFSYMLK